MSRGWSYNSGEWNAVCDSCGRKFKSSQLRKRWDGLMVCADDFESRHPQDFVKARSDKISVEWSRPQTDLIFVPINFTSVVSERLPLTENVGTVADFYRYVGAVNYGAFDADVVNGSAINLLTINASSVDPIPPDTEETMHLTEGVIVSLGFNESISESITLSENITEVEGEFSVDTVTMSESVLAYTHTNKLINAHYINEVTLG